MQTEDERKEEKWMSRMLPIANELAHYLSNDPMQEDDFAADAIEHLLAVHRRHPEHNLMENEGYCRKVLQNKIRDCRRVEERRTVRLERLSEETEGGSDCPDEHQVHQTLDTPFEDEQIAQFEDRDELLETFKKLRPRLSTKPRHLLDAIYALDTLDRSHLAQVTGIRNEDAVRTTLFNIQRKAKTLK